ncbi:MAG: 4Fe-4S binding protein [Myxococcales bacterium]|nr:4Fe-4S binding protein [Myxococcales bacterium]
MRGDARGTVAIDVERCKGCTLCVPACPPRVLAMSVERNAIGAPYPLLSPGCTGCGACALVCPDFCFEVFRFEARGARPEEGAR